MINYIRYYLNEIHWRNVSRKSNYQYEETKYANGITHPIDEANKYIYNLILSGQPFMLGRFGSTESYNMKVFDLKIKTKYNNAMSMLCYYSGFFPCTADKAMKFVELMKESCVEVDIIAIWKMFMEEYYIKTAMKKNVYMTSLYGIEPWRSEFPWSKALEGKKVLVIHPFASSIQNQYKKREMLFTNKDILPAFELKTLKAVQTIAGENDERFSDWFEALEWMYEEAIKIDFDIAIIGCGAYGFPLAAKLKRAGKQAIHLAGSTQILFGIKGKRWDSDPLVSSMYNEKWIYPDEQERPKESAKIEGGCYW